jgi:hypothetical protein
MVVLEVVKRGDPLIRVPSGGGGCHTPRAGWDNDYCGG